MMELFTRGSQPHSRLYKVLVVGEVDTGKSALIRRYVHNFFRDQYRSTVGVDFHLKIIPYNEELEIRLQLWDIAGQERFHPMTRAYFKGATGAFVLYDQSNVRSFEAVSRWKAEIDKKCFLPNCKKIPCILIGNKCDLPRDRDSLSDVEISQKAQDMGFVPKWYKCSAKTGEGIDDAVRMMIKYIMAVDTWNESISNPDEDEAYSRYQDTVRLREQEERDKQRKRKQRCAC